MSDPDFVPKRRLIGAITNAMNAVVTTTADHGYSSDEYVRMVVPNTYGMTFDYVLARITVTGATTFSIDVDTSLMDAFAAPALVAFTPAHCTPESELCDNVATF